MHFTLNPDRCSRLPMALPLTLVFLAVACSSSSFDGAAPSSSAARTPSAAAGAPQAGVAENVSADGAAAGSPLGTTAAGNGGGSDANSGANGAGSGSGAAQGSSSGGPVGGNLAVNGVLPTCPPRNESVLVLDFKSGWWSGDGGDFVSRILNGVSGPCNGTVKLEYHHITLSIDILSSSIAISNTQMTVPGSTTLTQGSANFATAFADPTWASYTQIWVLSGSAADDEDLQISNPFFQSVLSKIAASTAPLFLGVGYGSISHANAVATGLNLGVTFSTKQPEGNILDPMSSVKLVSSTTVQPATSSLFSNGVTQIADELNVAGVMAHGDQITTSSPAAQVLAQDGLGQNTLAVSTASGTRNAIFDADLPRYYAGWSSNESPGTAQLLKNIVVYLAH